VAFGGGYGPERDSVSAGFGRRKYRAMSDINVTPLVDVMLVLLIIFMVTAPLLVTGIRVDLPDSKAVALPEDQTPIQLSLNDKGELFLQDAPIARDALGPKLAAMAQARGGNEARVYVRASATLDYGQVMDVVGEVNAAGLKKVALVTERKRTP
jgi:biopolymer transport protein TolR